MFHCTDLCYEIAKFLCLQEQANTIGLASKSLARTLLNSQQYLTDHTCQTHLNCSHAARVGHLICLRYLHRVKQQDITGLDTVAAFHGHLDCLKYVHESGVAWSVLTIGCAAMTGHSECLIYAHKNGCPVDITMMYFCGLHPQCVEYLRAQDCKFSLDAHDLAQVVRELSIPYQK